MGRLKWTLTDCQCARFYSHCKRIGKNIGEKSGFVFRRIIFMLNIFFSDGGDLKDLSEMFDIMRELKKEKNNPSSIKEHIKNKKLNKESR